MLNASNIPFRDQMNKILLEYNVEFRQEIEKALTSSGEFLVAQLSSGSPVSNGSGEHLKDTFSQKIEYKTVRYIGATKTVPRNITDRGQKGGIPLSSLLEFSYKGNPFIQQIFEASQNEIYALFVRKMGGN